MTRYDQKSIDMIRNSGLFDEDFYLKSYPDVTMLGMDPIEHYLWVGAEMLRNPGPKFHTADYLEANGDVARAKLNPLLHFLGGARKEDHCSTQQTNSLPQAKLDLDAKFIESGAFRIKRQYRDYDFGREARFLQRTGVLYKKDRKKFDEIMVSIVMPTYNRAAVIPTAIQSVLDQDHQNWRLTIVDDGSDDSTPQVIAPFLRDGRIDYVFENHVGVSGARNAGIARSSGQYLAYLDSDNTWNPKFLRTMLVFMEMAELDAAYSSIHSSDDKGRTVCFRGDLFIWSACLKANYIDLNPFMHRRDLLDRRGSLELFDTSLKRFVDWDLILRLTRNARVSYAPFIGVEYYDGDTGGRITRTEYQGTEAAGPIAAIRAKHEGGSGQFTAIDTGAGVALAAQQIGGFQPDLRYILRYFPDYTINNAYQNLLYKPMVWIDVAPGDIDASLALLFAPTYEDARVVFHLHWTDPIFAPGTNEIDAARRVSAFLAKMRLFQSLGGRVLWTIHNVLSHETKYLAVEVDLHRKLSDLVDWIHVHHPKVVDATHPHYNLPSEKIVVAPHGNYVGALPNQMSRADARDKLDIPQEAIVFLFLGQIRGYKGIDELIDAFTVLSEVNDKIWLIVAGKVLGVSEQEIASRLSQNGRALFCPGYVLDEEMQVYLNSADAMLLPYRKVLTSGSLFLSLSFSLPVICPASGIIPNIIESGREGLIYDPGAPWGLRDAIQDFLELAPAERQAMSKSALETARSYGWNDSAQTLQRFVEALDFGQIEHTQINGNYRRWFVKGDRINLTGKRCISIILHYQNVDDTRECIRQLQLQGDDLGIIVISNSETLSDIRQLAIDYPGLFFVQSEDNVGYAAANNFGLWVCRDLQPEFFWIINPDIVVPDNHLSEMLSRIQSWPDHDFFGTTIVPHHDPTRVLFCGGEVQLGAGAAPRHMNMGVPTNDLPDSPFECDYLTGANIFGRTSALQKAGYMDEDYFLYFEETDWFLRMFQAAGLPKPLVFPDLAVRNHKRSENGLVPSRYYIYYFVRNSLLFGKKFTPSQTVLTEIEARKFADSWLAKILRAAPDRTKEFESLVERAFAEGREGKAGRAAL